MRLFEDNTTNERLSKLFSAITVAAKIKPRLTIESDDFSTLTEGDITKDIQGGKEEATLANVLFIKNGNDKLEKFGFNEGTDYLTHHSSFHRRPKGAEKILEFKYVPSSKVTTTKVREFLAATDKTLTDLEGTNDPAEKPRRDAALSELKQTKEECERFLDVKSDHSFAALLEKAPFPAKVSIKLNDGTEFIISDSRETPGSN
jgi:hypothetical protein